MNFFTNVKSLKLMAAAGVVAFYCGASPVLGANYTFTGLSDVTLTAYHEIKTGDYNNLRNDKITATGGTAVTGDTGGGGMHVQGNYINNGETEANGGEGDISSVLGIAYGGVGIQVDGEVVNNNDLKAVGGKGTTKTSTVSGNRGGGGIGINAIGNLVNHASVDTTGGYAFDHEARGGIGIAVKDLKNYNYIKTTGGDAMLSTSGMDAAPVGGDGLALSGSMYNEGTIEGRGGTGMMDPLTIHTCAHPVLGGNGLTANGSDESINKGTIKGGGGDVTLTRNHPVQGGVGIQFIASHVHNYGKVDAQGGNSDVSATGSTATGGVGIDFGGGLTNYTKTFTAIAGNGQNTTTGGSAIGGTGATVANGMVNKAGASVFSQGGNADAFTGSSASGGVGLTVSGGTYNYGDLVARGGVKAGTGGTETPGVGAIFEDGLTSYKDAFVTLLGYDSLTNADVGAALKLGGTPKGSADDLAYGAWFKLGSYLAGSTGGGAYIDAGGLAVVFEKDASTTIPVSAVVSMVASSGGVGTSVTHTGFVQNTSSTLIDANLASYTGPVMDVTFNQRANGANYDFDFTAERIGWSSQQTTGIASSMLAAWERDLAGQGINDTNYAWAELLSSVDFQPTAEALRARARDLFGDTMPLSTTQAMSSMGRSARFVDGLFSKNMQSLAKCRQTNSCNYNENANDRRNAGLVCGVDTDPLMIWAQPFYFTGRQNGKDAGFHKFDEDYYGVTTGVAYDADFAILSAELHYYQGDLKTRKYKADVDALGFELGIGRVFKIADNFNPWVEIRAGYTWMELDQKRTDANGVKATSKPDAGVWTGGITVNNAFSITEQIKITPKIGVDIMHMNMDGYTERGSSLATKVKPDDYTSVQGTIGVQVDYNPTDDFYIEARAAYHYEFADKSADVKAHGVGLSSNLKIPGDDLSRSSATLGVGTGVKLTDNVSLQADYDVRVGDKYVGHQVSATLTFTF